MSTKFRNLKNDLKDLENETEDSGLGVPSKSTSGGSKTANYILVIAFLVTLLFYAGNRVSTFFQDFENPISDVVQSFNEYDADLLAGMGSMMEDMGYGVLSNEELSSLRDEGVTATETQRLHDAGYTEVTLAQLVELQDADVSSTYASMMKELGYEFTIDDLLETRRNGVTANFTSRMMDLGYTLEELTKENLIRMRSIEVTDRLAERLIEEIGERPSVDELVRYRISNQ
ncbi:MAG: hypothetical protein RLN90_04870 [Balneolaceae bacterium]